MQTVDLFIRIRATNHDDELMNDDEWKESFRSIIDQVNGDIDLELDVLRVNVRAGTE